MWATYKEWRKNGRVVKQGESSDLRDPLGTPLFHHNQTVVLPPEPVTPYPDDFVIDDDVQFFNGRRV